MSTLIVILITVASLATVVAAMIGLIKPQIMSRSSAVSPGEEYYSAMYAAVLFRLAYWQLLRRLLLTVSRFG